MTELKDAATKVLEAVKKAKEALAPSRKRKAEEIDKEELLAPGAKTKKEHAPSNNPPPLNRTSRGSNKAKSNRSL